MRRRSVVHRPGAVRVRHGVLAVWIAIGLAGVDCARTRPDRNGTRVEDVGATVHRFPIDSDTYVLVADAPAGTQYLPDSLPTPFREDGLRVRFSGTVREPPPNVRL